MLDFVNVFISNKTNSVYIHKKRLALTPIISHMHIFLSLMGCHQSKARKPAGVINTSSSAGQIYVKSALKKPRSKGKIEKLSSQRKKPTVSKSVNFDDKVQVKSRTPTPKQTRYENPIKPQLPSDDEHRDIPYNNDQASSISSEDEDAKHEQTKSAPPQRNPSNSYWPKKNAIGIIPATDEPYRRSPVIAQQPLINPTENPNISQGNVFRVRRKVQYSVLQRDSSPVLPSQPVSVPSHLSNATSSPILTQRIIPNTNNLLIEHRVPSSNIGTTPQATYYAFTRRPIDSETSTNK